MATRRTPIRQWEINKAQGQKIVNRLLRHVMYVPPPEPVEGETPKPVPPSQDARKCLLTDAQVRAALGLLKKFIPDLKSIEHTGNPDHPVIHEIRRTIVDPRPPDGASVSTPADPE